MTDPVQLPLLRQEVGRLRARESRRRFDAAVHVGQLGATCGSCPVPVGDPVLDAGTRTEVVLRLLEAGGPTTGGGLSVWVTRPGEPVLQDCDLAWLSASCRAFAAVGCSLDGFWTVTRTGWLDVRTGERRIWKRLRL
ncbi:MAG TPA: hypothetical protein VFY11_06005 [Nocardioidaceae bacterium]|nr:hypothetical protein [Nocardioidaceae bacterium]